jgi:hypothetical protein
MIEKVKDIRQKIKSVIIKDAMCEIHYNYLKNVEPASVSCSWWTVQKKSPPWPPLA